LGGATSEKLKKSKSIVEDPTDVLTYILKIFTKFGNVIFPGLDSTH
jgi:hypothetical protein